MILHILGLQIGEWYHAVAHSLRCGRGSRSRRWSPLPHGGSPPHGQPNTAHRPSKAAHRPDGERSP